MKNKILMILAVCLVLPIVSANVTLEQEIHTYGNIEATHNLFADGFIKVFINGLDLLNLNTSDSLEVNSYNYGSGSEFSSKSFQGIMNRAMIHINTQIKNNVLSGSTYRSSGIAGYIGELLYNTFMPRWELELRFMENKYHDEIFEKWIEIKDTFDNDKEAYCHAKFLVSQKYGFDKFDCYNKTIYIDPTNDDGIILESLDPVIEDCVWVYDTTDENSSCGQYCGMWMFETASRPFNTKEECEQEKLETETIINNSVMIMGLLNEE